MLSSSRPVSCFDHRFLRVRDSLFLGSPPTAADQESGPLGQRQWEELPEIKRLHSMVETVVVKPTKNRITRGLPQPVSPNCRVTLPQPASPGRVAVWSLSFHVFRASVRLVPTSPTRYPGSRCCFESLCVSAQSAALGTEGSSQEIYNTAVRVTQQLRSGRSVRRRCPEPLPCFSEVSSSLPQPASPGRVAVSSSAVQNP